MTDTPLWLVRHVEVQLGARFVNAEQVHTGAFRRSWIVNTSEGAVVVSRTAGGEPKAVHLALPDDRQSLTCTVCDWRMEFIGADFPIRAYCSNCGTLHEVWHDGNVQRLGEPQVVMPAEVLADAPAVAGKPAKRAAKKAKKTSAYVDYKGDVDPVIDVEGIGATYAGRLERAGIKTTARLCYETPRQIAKVAQVPAKTAKLWQTSAELMKVSGIGPQYAEALARAGIAGIEGLKKTKADAIAQKVNKYLDGLDVNVLGQKVTTRRVENWQAKAAGLRRVRQTVPAE